MSLVLKWSGEFGLLPNIVSLESELKSALRSNGRAVIVEIVIVMSLKIAKNRIFYGEIGCFFGVLIIVSNSE